MKQQAFINKHLHKKTILSYLLYPLSWIYLLIFYMNYIYHLIKKPYQISGKCQLVCVGNIVAGGSGKTPFIILLADLLKDSKKKTAIISRGYKGAFENSNQQISDENNVFDNASEAGDEPYLLAVKCPGVPVVVGKNRIKSISLLIKKYPDLDYILMDDGFQHFKVKPDISFVLFNSGNPLGNGFLLPAGILREPLFMTKRASGLVCNGKDSLPQTLYRSQLPVIQVCYQVSDFVNTKGEPLSKDFLSKSQLCLMSAIGNPGSFENTIKCEGLSFIRHFIYPDHFDYRNESEFHTISLFLEENAVDLILITEKDYSKLERIKHSLPVVIVKTRFVISPSDQKMILKVLKV